MTNKIRTVLTVIVLLLIIAAVVAGYQAYRSYLIKKKINTVIHLISAIEEVDYGKITYRPGADLFIIEGLSVCLKNGGKMQAEHVELAEFYNSELINISADNISYHAESVTGASVSFSNLELSKLDPSTLTSFAAALKRSDKSILENWLISPVTMDSFSFTGLKYNNFRQPAVVLEYFSLKGPLIQNKPPERLQLSFDNLSFYAMFSESSYVISNFDYSRTYDPSSRTFQESYDNIAFNDLFTLSLDASYADFDMNRISQVLKERNPASSIADFMKIKELSFNYQDKSFVSFLTTSLFYLERLGGKQYLADWISAKLPLIMPDISERYALSEALTQFIYNPESISLSLSPQAPVPLGAFRRDDAESFNSMGLKVKINNYPAITLHMKTYPED